MQILSVMPLLWSWALKELAAFVSKLAQCKGRIKQLIKRTVVGLLVTWGAQLVWTQSPLNVHLFAQDTYEARRPASVSHGSGLSSSPLGGSCTAHSRPRQLETIILNQQTPAYFHHTKGAMCTFSTLPANSRACVCVPFKNASALSSSISWFISSTLFFSLQSLISQIVFPCPSWLQCEGRSQAAARAWPSNQLPWLPLCLSLCLCCSLCLTLWLIIRSYLWARCGAGYELRGKS